jgi:hypothetical protein
MSVGWNLPSGRTTQQGWQNHHETYSSWVILGCWDHHSLKPRADLRTTLPGSPSFWSFYDRPPSG